VSARCESYGRSGPSPFLTEDSLRKKRALYTMNSMIVQTFSPLAQPFSSSGAC
jgi:hypothetical protein